MANIRLPSLSASHVTPEPDSKRGKRRVQVSNPRSIHKTIPSIFKQNIMDTAESLTKSCKRLEPRDGFILFYLFLHGRLRNQC